MPPTCQNRGLAMPTQMSGQPPPRTWIQKKPKAYSLQLLNEVVQKIQEKKLTFAQAQISHPEIPKATLINRLQGATDRHKANESRQTLLPWMELALVQYAMQRGWRGDPLSLLELRELAGKIAGCPTLPKGWAYRFLDRHPNLKRGWTKKGEQKRAQALNGSTVQEYFEILKDIIEEKEIHPSDIYNADEKGVFLGGGNIRFRAVVAKAQKQAFATGDENRKMLTVLECIGVGGKLLPPLLIHEGASHDGEWSRDNPCQAR
jgi:hypothetical protein